MPNVTFRFLEAASFVGNIITWRLKEPFSHAAIIIDGYAYSSTFPLVAMVPVSHHSVGFPSRNGMDITIELSEEEFLGLKNWCESQLCKPYDLLSLLGWIFGIQHWQSLNSTYCFEFIRRPLTYLGILPRSSRKELISASRLIGELQGLATSRPVTLGESVERYRRTQEVQDDQGNDFWSEVAVGGGDYCHKNATYAETTQRR
jgi:hypothetical protein